MTTSARARRATGWYRSSRNRGQLCESTKKRFASRVEAERAAAAATRHEPVTIRAYKCPKCRDYHLTSKVQRRKES